MYEFFGTSYVSSVTGVVVLCYHCIKASEYHLSSIYFELYCGLSPHVYFNFTESYRFSVFYFSNILYICFQVPRVRLFIKA